MAAGVENRQQRVVFAEKPSQRGETQRIFATLSQWHKRGVSPRSRSAPAERLAEAQRAKAGHPFCLQGKIGLFHHSGFERHETTERERLLSFLFAHIHSGGNLAFLKVFHTHKGSRVLARDSEAKCHPHS